MELAGTESWPQPNQISSITNKMTHYKQRQGYETWTSPLLSKHILLLPKSEATSVHLKQERFESQMWL